MAKKPKPPLQVVDLPVPDAAPAPPGLGEHGIAMWTAILAEYDIRDVGGRLLLAQCAHAQDMVVRLRAQIDKDGLMVEMASGKRTHPAVKEELGYRAFITSTLKKLGIVDEPVQQLGGAYKKYGPGYA
jgi:hypothetical protein